MLKFWQSFLLYFLLVSVFCEEERNLGSNQDVNSAKERWMHPRHKFNGRKILAVEDADYWVADAQNKLGKKVQVDVIKGQAKNVIFYLGDGMSVPTVTAARILKGQTTGAQFGEEAELYMESLPYTGFSKTFCSDAQVADSACSATAYLCGSKGNDGTIGVTPAVLRYDCDAQADESNHVHSVLKWAQDAGKSTGIITTTRVTHASPSGTFAHIADRDWENNQKIEDRIEGASEKCDDIAEQLVFNNPGRRMNVIMGGGRNQFTTTDKPDPEYPNLRGYRTDNKDLIDAWIEGKSNESAQYITTKSELSAIDPTKVDFLLGLFEPDHLLYLDEMDGKDDPTLEEMVKVGIQILQKNPNGFFLFVEGGKIDHGHHANMVQRALVETIEFDKAIAMGDSVTSDDDTLIVVTADHAHVMHISGYPIRGNDILGHGLEGTYDEPVLALDGLPYNTLGYGNGPGWFNSSDGDGWLNPDNLTLRRDVTEDDFKNPNYVVPVPVPLGNWGETHGGDDVPIFAKGPYSHLLTGTHMQSYIPHVVQYAACIGPERALSHCKDNPDTGAGNNLKIVNSILLINSAVVLALKVF